MSGARLSLDELGYKPAREGFMSGTILKCGHFIEPPFVFECKACSDEPGAAAIGATLRVNGVILWTSCSRLDDCGRPVVQRRPATKPDKCRSEFYALIDDIQDAVDALDSETPVEVADGIVLSKAKALASFSCIGGPTKIKYLGLRKLDGYPKHIGWTLEFCSNGMCGGSISVSYSYRDRAGEYRPTQADWNRVCQENLENAKQRLTEIGLVFQCQYPMDMSKLSRDRILDVINSDSGLLKKWSKLHGLSICCPECLLARAQELGK